MAHFALLWKARTIEKYRQNYENEKINSIIMSNSGIPERTLFQRWRHYRHGMQKRLSRTFSKWYPEGTTVSNFFVSFRTDMKLPTILLRSLYGFIGGLLLTYLGFMFFVFQLSLSLLHATFLSSVLGVLLTLGLTFSNRMRCIIFLLVPQLFSRVGRYTLTCYALVLILTGPATNTLKNSEVLSESMACSQEQIKLSVKQINDSIKKPFNSIKDSLKITIESMKYTVRKLKIALIKFNRVILSIASVIQSNFSWLCSVADVCNEALGTPYEKCLNALKKNYEKYNEYHDFNHVKHKDVKKRGNSIMKKLLDTIGVKYAKDKVCDEDRPNLKVEEFKKPKVSKNHFHEKDIKMLKECENYKDVKRSKDKSYERPWFCNTSNVVKLGCSAIKSFEKFCIPADFAEETFLATMRKKVKTFVRRISTLIHVQLNIHHTYIFIGNTNSTNQVAAGIVTEIRNRADPILTWLSWSSCVTSLFLLLIIFRAKHYQHMFETRSRFDNRFITKEFRELDLKRLREGRETVLPLNRRERAKYVTTTSFRLVASEKVHLNRSAVFMTITTFKLLIHIVADYSLYWVLVTIRYHGKLQSPLQPGLVDTGAFITGIGFVARLLQSFIDAFNLQLSVQPLDNSCLPKPYPPDFKRYCQIGYLIFLLWFFALFEPYGLRLRHLIMGHYRPQRAKARAVWLYNHILRTRVSFMKFARRRLHREYKYSSQSKLTFRRWMQSYIPLCWLRSLLGIRPTEEPNCLLCNITGDMNDPNMEFTKCEVPNCPGIYCTSCFSDIGQLCTICLSPFDYGDLSDVSLEKGSSDEDNNDNENSDDKNNDDNNQSGNNRRISDDGTDDSEEANDGGTSRTSKTVEQNRVVTRFGKKYMKDETFLLLQHSNVVHDADNNRLHSTQRKDAYIHQIRVEKNKNKSVVVHIQTTKYKQESNENTEMFKDHNNNYIRTHIRISTFSLLQYSVYEITKNPFEIKKIEGTTQLAKLLRRKKIIRRQKTNDTKNHKYFITCSNTKKNAINKKTEIDRNQWQAKDTNEEKIPEKFKVNAKNNLSSIPFEALIIKNGSRKNTKSKNYTTEPKSEICNSSTGTFCATFYKYWTNIKSKLLPCKNLTNTKKDLPPTKEQKHKRKKKSKKTKKHISVAAKGSQLNKRNSRLLAYLNERYWATNSLKKLERLSTIKKQICLTNKTVSAEKNVTVNNIIIPRLHLGSSSESMLDPPMSNTCFRPNLTSNEESSKIIDETDYADRAIERFFKSIVCSSRELTENISLDNSVRKQNELHEVITVTETNTQNEKSISEARTLHHISCLKGYVPQENVSGFLNSRLPHPVMLVKSLYSLLFSRDKEKESTFKQNQKPTMKLSVKGKDKIQSLKVEVIAKETDNREKQPEEKDNKQTQIIIKPMAKTADKAVSVIPTMNSCGCQNNRCVTQDFSGQITDTKIQTKRPISQGYDVEVMTGNPTCTCAVQYQRNNKDVGIVCERTRCFDCCQDSKLKKDVSLDVSGTEYSTKSEDSKTDTTVYSSSNIDHNTFRTHKNGKVRKTRFQTVSKSNQATLTDRAKHCDASTATYDWWSPIVDKKDILTRENIRVEKNKKDYDDLNQRKKRVFNSRKMASQDKLVSFKSKTQLIPRDCGSRNIVMSPSRYLLESQKYYNATTYAKFTSSRVFPIANYQKNQCLESDRCQASSCHPRYRGRKPKRLEDSYSPRKMASPRMRREESGRPPETTQRNKRNNTLR